MNLLFSSIRDNIYNLQKTQHTEQGHHSLSKGNKHTFRANTHVHSPYSYSSFDTIDQMAEAASTERIDILGINDFNTFSGHEEFAAACLSKKIYPLFNVEFRCISDQEDKCRWNDPVDPGVIYLCGKGVGYPNSLSGDSQNRMNALWKGSQDHIWKIIARLNHYFKAVVPEITLDYNEIRSEYSKGTLRERHLAKAIYDKISKLDQQAASLDVIFRRLFNTDTVAADVADQNEMQDQILFQLFKYGKPGFVKHSNHTAISFTEAKEIILQSGGIPCYPLLGDTVKEFTENESHLESLAEKLTTMGIYAVEFISTRCSLEYLKKSTAYFRENGFCVTFGTEHNQPEIVPLLPSARDSLPFDRELKDAAHEGAAIIAAHQEHHKENYNGFLDSDGEKAVSGVELMDFIRRGEDAILRLKTERAGA